MINFFLIFPLIFIIITIIKLQKSKNKSHIVFNYLLLPLILYYSIGHLIFSSKVAKSIGWNTSPFQYELGYFTLSIFIVGLYASINNYSIQTLRSIAYIWIIFIIMASINHIKEILIDKNYSFNNISPIFMTIITSTFVYYYI